MHSDMKLIMEDWRQFINEAVVPGTTLYHGAYAPVNLNLTARDEPNDVGSLYTFNKASLGEKAIKYAGAWAANAGEFDRESEPVVYELGGNLTIVDLQKPDDSKEYRKFVDVFMAVHGENEEALVKALARQDLYNYVDYQLDFRDALIKAGIDGASFRDGLDEPGFVALSGTATPPITVVFNLAKLNKLATYTVEFRNEDKEAFEWYKRPSRWNDKIVWNDATGDMDSSYSIDNIIIKKKS